MRNPFVRRSLQVFASSFIAVAIIGAFVFVTQGRDIPVLNPSGTIADQQYILILITVGLGIFVVVPVFILLFVIAFRYREGNTKAKYEPEMEGNKGLEILWWGIPCLIILALAIITYVSTHALDPYKKLESTKDPIKVQVVSLESNWLFIYPDYDTATLNFMNIPENTPIDLTITSDAPMNSFWVPALAGQVYSMAGMSTQLHFMADKTGTFNGVTANISGNSYADMTFKVISMTSSAFNTWTRKPYNSENTLTWDTYQKLAVNKDNQPNATYKLMDDGLFDKVVAKYMGMDMDHSEGTATEGMAEGQTYDYSTMEGANR